MRTRLFRRKSIRIIISFLLISSLAVVSNGTAIASAPPTGAFTKFAGITDAAYWRGLASSSDGSRIAAISTVGQLWTSTNSGTTWESHTALSTIGTSTWQNIVTNASGETLTVASGNGSVYSSGDFGTTWTATNLTGPSGALYGVTTSADGKILAVCDLNSNKVLVSTNAGLSWSDEGPSGTVTGNFRNVVLSGDGLTLAAIASGGNIWTAKYSPTTTPKWTWRDTGISAGSAPAAWRGLSISSNGNFIAASAYGGKIYVSSDSGTNWSVPSGFDTLGNIVWQRITMSQDGRYISATVGSYIYSSRDFGATVTRFSAPENLYSISPLDTSGISWIAGSAGTAGSQPGGVYKLTITWPLAAPAFTISSSAETKTVGTALAGYTITSTGGLIDSYTVSNLSTLTSLGLTFDTGTGLISGTPTGVVTNQPFVVTALNASGSDTRTFTLNVVAALAAPAFTISSSAETKTVGTALAGYTITSTGGLIDSYTVSNSSSLTSLGLTFDTSTGLISGTPSVVTSSTAFTITALNATGSANQTFTLTVNAAPVVPAPAKAAQPVEPPPPAQTSVIPDLSLTGSGSTEGGNLFIVDGTFSAPILKITIDGSEILKPRWSQNGTDLILLMPSSTAGTVSIQIYNGQFPLLPAIKYTYVEAAPIQTEVTAPVIPEKTSAVASTPATSETKTATSDAAKSESNLGTKPKKPIATKAVIFGFKYNSALVKTDINAELTALGLRSNSKIEIVGYAQPTAPKDDRRISLARALKIQQLIAKAFPQAQSKVLAMGSKKQPLCVATQNRCVLVKIIS
ncbi:Sialidase_non-viral domain containing protein [Candidatus Nanopelagicaceae bacterium]